MEHSERRHLCADEESAELDRLRRLLCIPKADIQQLHKDICGRLYTEVRCRIPPFCITSPQSADGLDQLLRTSTTASRLSLWHRGCVSGT